jgi:hypothetical protein
VDELTRTGSPAKALSKFDFDPSDPWKGFHWMLKTIEKFLFDAVMEGKPPEIVVLSPFLYRDYVRVFISFVERLRGKLPGLRVMVVTRRPEHVSNGQEHGELVGELMRAGIVVKMKALKTMDGGMKPFHGKAVIIGAEYVIAGSINPLAPSYFETPIVTTLIMLLRNPGTWKALRKLLVDEEGGVPQLVDTWSHRLRSASLKARRRQRLLI